MTDHEIAKKAAREALQEFLLVLGVDASNGHAIVEVQRDFHHLRQLRLLGGVVRKQVVTGITSAAVTGMIAAVAFYFHHA